MSFYRQGEFIDLCRGPHIPSARRSGRSSCSRSPGRTGRATPTTPSFSGSTPPRSSRQEELDEHLKQVEEAKRRDHRVLGKQLELFTISNDVGPGLSLWLPKGAIIRAQLEDFIKDELARRGYQPVYTPHIGRVELYQTSGHFPYYRDSQFPPIYLDPFMQSVQQLFALLFQDKLTTEQVRRPVRGRPQAATPTAWCPISFPGFGHAKTDRRQDARDQGLVRRAGGVPAQADELPAPHSDLQGRAAQLSRPAGAAGRVRHRLSLRADRASSAA